MAEIVLSSFRYPVTSGSSSVVDIFSANAAKVLNEAGFKLVFDAGGIESYSGEIVTD